MTFIICLPYFFKYKFKNLTHFSFLFNILNFYRVRVLIKITAVAVLSLTTAWQLRLLKNSHAVALFAPSLIETIRFTKDRLLDII